ADGRAVNRELLLSLNRDIELKDKGSLSPDMNAAVTLGNSWDLNDDFTFGALGNISYGTDVRNQNQRERNFANPERDSTAILRTYDTENTTAAMNFSVDFRGKHGINTNSYLLRNF